MTPTKPESLSRQSRLVRRDGAKAYPLAAIEQAEAILRALDRHLFLTHDQLEALCFQEGLTATGKQRAPRGAAYAANTALRRLFDGGYVERVPVFLPGQRPGAVKAHFVNVLSSRGGGLVAAALRAEGRTPRWRRTLLPHPWQPILHGFWIREFAVASQVAARAASLRWWSWFDDRQLTGLKLRHGAHFTNIPDGFFVLTNPTTGRDCPHFVEIDLGSQTVAARTPQRLDWRRKVEGYVGYINHHFREEFGVNTPPVVLTVTESEARLSHLLAATAAAGGGGRFWFTTLAALLGPCHDPASSTRMANGAFVGLQTPFWAPIWHVPTASQPRSLAVRCGISGG